MADFDGARREVILPPPRSEPNKTKNNRTKKKSGSETIKVGGRAYKHLGEKKKKETRARERERERAALRERE